MINEFKNENRFLSNFHPVDIYYCQLMWNSAEHIFQAMKAQNGEDFKLIKSAKTPGQAKRLGAKVELPANWDSAKKDLMKGVVLLKFTQNPDLSILLKNTGDRELIEGNYWHDNYWGNCMCDKCKNITGENHLGKILMDIRIFVK